MKRVLVVRLLMIGFALIATAIGGRPTTAQAAALSLREVVQLTLDSNPEIRAAIANRRATDYELRQSQGRYFPDVSVEGDVGREKIDRPLGFAEDVNDRWPTRRQIALTVRQVLFDGW